MDDVAKIAAGLSDGARAALIAGNWNVAPVSLELMDWRLVQRCDGPMAPFSIELTPHGLALRAHMETTNG